MSQTKVHHVIGIDGTTLIVFYTEAHCWRLELIATGGAVKGKRIAALLISYIDAY